MATYDAVSPSLDQKRDGSSVAEELGLTVEQVRYGGGGPGKPSALLGHRRAWLELLQD